MACIVERVGGGIPVGPPPADPVDVCVREFHEMGSRAFQAKYLNNSLNRKFYEAAIDRGICGQWFCAIHAEDEAWRYCVLELGDEGGEG
jgi:hypothetical protein